ncbi:MAG: hypothetical protein MUE33_11025, partial [Cytophagaceae bacterium]|nr:hypothetical protein [Cytophagaceae bacterium]
QIISVGNEGNCGCMGQVLSFTPLEAIIKNILTFALLSFVYFNTPSKPDSKHRYPSVLFLTVTIFCFVYYPWECCCSVTNSISSVLPYPITPSIPDSLEDKHTSNPKHDSIPTKPQKSIKKDPSKVKTPSNVVDIPKNSKQKLAPVSSVFGGYTKYNTGDIFPDKGNKIVCLFNVDCDHCMETAKKIGELHRKSPLEVLILFWGNPDQTAAFFKVAGVEFPYQFIEAGKFFRLLDTANSPPRVVVMSQGNIIGDFNSDNFDITKLKELYTTYAP